MDGETAQAVSVGITDEAAVLLARRALKLLQYALIALAGKDHHMTNLWNRRGVVGEAVQFIRQKNVPDVGADVMNGSQLVAEPCQQSDARIAPRV